MNKIKDIFYNKNDIVIILAILAIASFLIWNRIDAIMDYPSELIAANGQQSELEEEPSVEEPSAEEPEAEAPAPEQPATTPEAVVMYSVYIESGESLQSIGGKFADIGLFRSAEEFVKLANEMGITTKIRAGNFVMPSDSTPEEVMNILTKPGQ